MTFSAPRRTRRTAPATITTNRTSAVEEPRKIHYSHLPHRLLYLGVTLLACSFSQSNVAQGFSTPKTDSTTTTNCFGQRCFRSPISIPSAPRSRTTQLGAVVDPSSLPDFTLLTAAADAAVKTTADLGWWGQYINIFKSALTAVHDTVDGPLRSGLGVEQTWGVSIALFTAGEWGRPSYGCVWLYSWWMNVSFGCCFGASIDRLTHDGNSFLCHRYSITSPPPIYSAIEKFRVHEGPQTICH